MLGSTSGLLVSSSEGVSPASHEAVVAVTATSSIMSGGGDGGGDGEFYEGDRSSGGNRWPRQETLALLKIRSDMDAVFRDSSIKGPLWDEVSRKMGELGYHRSSKKCKEKFENVYKYHKRTKDGRVGKSDGKTYRFFDQLEALEQHQLSLSPFPSPATPRGQQTHPTAHAAVPVTMVIPASVTVTSSIVHTPQVHVQHPMINVMQHRPTAATGSPIQIGNESSPSATPSSSSLSGSDEEVIGSRSRSRGRRKRKWKEFFERLTKEVIYKQEELQSKFLDAVEKRDCDRLAREEAWKAQEVARLSREHEILVQERSMAAAKDAALMAFLQKLSDQQQIPLSLPIQIQTQMQTQTRGMVVPVVTTIATPVTQLPPQPQVTRIQENPVSLAIPVSTPVQAPIPPQPQPQPLSQIPPELTRQQALVLSNRHTHADNQMQPSPSRWPKTEVEALINLRTQLDEKYQENGPKGPLWEEISSLMKNLGYNRNPKRCKEKWENINKYFKKVKESNKRRPEDSKTCPYFHQLDSLYRGKTPKMDMNTNPSSITHHSMINTNPIMARPEQQWPSQDPGSEDDDSDSDGDGDEDDEEGSPGGYEIVANSTTTTTTKTTTE